jgi:hypothetical protein
MNKFLLLSAVLSVLLTGCLHASNEKIPSQEILKIGKGQVTEKKEQIWQQVTVKYNDFEGGFYGLITIDGDKLLPMNLIKKYQLPGTVLKVKGVMIKDAMTTQQWGQAFKITDVELITLGKANQGETS